MFMEFLTPWYADNNDALTFELKREAAKGHVLHDVSVNAVARRQDTDDVLFSLQDGTGRVAVVHLTWKMETNPAWPRVSMFQDFASWLETMNGDHAEFNGQ
jgi:hypothetical protein